MITTNYYYIHIPYTHTHIRDKILKTSQLVYTMRDAGKFASNGEKIASTAHSTSIMLPHAEKLQDCQN